MRTRAQAHDPANLDVAYLATTYGVEEAELHALIDAPTTELVRDFLATITIKGQESDDLKAEKVKVDVELENTVRTTDTKVKAQKAAVTRHVKEIEELRTKLNEAETARERLASEIEQLRSSSTGSSAETQTLRQRIETLEASNRDALALVESKSTEKDRIATELSEQHSKLLELRREISKLEERNQSLENAASSQKFKEQSLLQEIDLLKRNNEWHANELKTRSEEHTKFRKERNARISTLERDLEESNSAVEALKRTEITLRQRLDEVQAKADEAFARIATLQEEAARKEQDFRTELSGSKRLGELQAQNAATHKARLADVQNELEQLREATHEEVGRLQAEIETERMDKEDAERKVAELELKVESLEQQMQSARPLTPLRNGSPVPGTPGRAGSPNALSGSMRKTVNGLSFTQLYTQFTEAQEELENERRRSAKLSTALDELINEVETKKPELEDLREEQQRLEEEVLNYSGLLGTAYEDRDRALREVDEWQGKANAAEREGQILRQQLRDLSAQVKVLLVELQSRDQGLDELSVDERLEFERAARGELEEGALEGMTDTGRLISERFVIFRTVDDLQNKYQELLRATRVMTEQLEGDEAREKARKSAADAEEVDALRQQVSRYKDELQSTATQIDSYMKERDMFRRMLQHRGQLAPDADLQSMFGQSVGPGTPSRNSMAPPATPRGKDVEDLNKLLKEQQTFFDQYRNESATDRRMLKEQADALAREKSTLQADIARAQSQLTLATERYEMLNSNFQALRAENGELQKRSQQMAEQAAKQDLRTQQVAEELVESRSMVDSLRNENANAKAEKELWRRIEARLTDDNKSLMDERSRLNKLVTDLQNLQNERELSESDSRRRMQSRVEGLESELAETKKKLEAEVDDNRKATLRREYEETQNRTRIDDLVKSLGNVREELAAAKTARDSLQARVDEMKIELRTAEEKVTALQPRPTPRPEASRNGASQPGGDEELPAEQRPALEISDLRRDLDLSKTELESAKQQVEQFRSIAQTTEEELASYNDTAEQYKQDTDKVLAEKDAKINELEQRVEDLTSELTTLNTELSQLRGKVEDSDRILAEQKASLDSEIVRLRDDVDRRGEEKRLLQEDIKAQAEIAQEAQQNYEAELVKHAEAAKSLGSVRNEYNDLRSEVAGLRAEAEAAKASLERGEESWSEQRERFEQELEQAKRKRHDLDEQNKILHQNLENFSNELAALRQGRAADSEARESTPSASGDGNMQDVIKFLRREKEIVDVQYELVSQEAKRLQQQLDYANSQLEESRQKLIDERRQAADRASSEGSTNKLMQTINELNLYRESATTLRNETSQAREKLKEKVEEVERLIAELEPLKGRVSELEGELESKEGEMKLLQDDRDHWRERTQNIISKYDRVDPAELEEMKKQIEDLKVEKERLETEQGPLREQVAGIDIRLEEVREEAKKDKKQTLDNFVNRAKDQDRKRKQEIQDLKAEKEGLNIELEKTRADLTTANTGLEQAKSALQEAQQASSRKTVADDVEEGQVQEDGTAAGDVDHAALHARIAAAEANASEHARRAELLDAEVQTLQARVQELEARGTALQQQLEHSQAHDGLTQTSGSPENAETLEKLQHDLATAQSEVETLRANAAAAQRTVNAEPALGEKSVAEQVAEQVETLRKEMEEQHNLAVKHAEQQTQERINKMKQSLQKQLTDGRAKIREEFENEKQAAIQKIQDEHAAAMEKLKADHRAEIERLTQQGSVAVQKAADVKDEDASPGLDVTKLELSEQQARDLIKTNAVVKQLLTNNVKSHVDKQTAKIRDTIAAKDAEIAELKLKIDQVASDEDGEIKDDDIVTKAELERQLDLLRKEKDEAVAQAEARGKTLAKQGVEQAEKKAAVQVNMGKLAQAQVGAVKQAVKDTPEKPVKDVWEIAAKTKPTAPAVKSSPASGSVSSLSNPAVPSSPVSGQPAGSFGQPSAAVKSAINSSAPNPQATEFKPSASNAAPAASASTAPAAAKPVANVGTGPAALRGLAGPGSGIPQPGGGAAGSKLPRAPSRQGSMSGASGNPAQGAAGQRGGAAAGKGLPRGGRGVAAGGRGNAAAAANAGQKRQHDGASPAGGDTKRTRGGPPGGPSTGGS